MDAYDKGYQQATADFINDEIKFLRKLNKEDCVENMRDRLKKELLKLKQMLVEK